MIYDQVYQQQLNALQNGTPIPNVPIAQQQQAPSQGGGLINQGAGLAGKGAGMYAGGQIGSLFGSSGVATPQLVGAKVVGANAPISLTASPALPGAGATGASGATGGLSGAGILGTVAPLAAIGHGAYTAGKFFNGDKLNTGEKLAYALPTAGLSLFSDQLQGLFGGKSEEQNARESTRGKLAELGLLRDDGDKAYSVLFEGQDPYLMGFNGDFLKQDNSIKDLARVLGRDAEGMKDRKTWDIDYTSDLDLLTSTVSNDLGRLLTGGGLGDQQRQVFNELANASLADTDREFNQDNWSNTIGDMRSLYQKAGIENADMAYGRLNELVSSGNLDDKARDEIMQSISMTFDDGSFDLANRLNEGRWNGVDMTGAGIQANPSNVTNQAQSGADLLSQAQNYPLDLGNMSNFAQNIDMNQAQDLLGKDLSGITQGVGTAINTRPQNIDPQHLASMVQLAGALK